MKWLRNYLGTEIPLFSLIVFSERCELKKVTVEDPDIKVIKRNRTYATVCAIWNEKEDTLSDEEVDAVYQKLKKLTKVSNAEKETHIQNIKEKYDDRKENDIQKVEGKENKFLKETAKMMQKNGDEFKDKEGRVLHESEKKICPLCGCDLILRTAKRGANVGKQFYGCSAFPKCRYILNLTEESY